ncbi:MAG: hypothetical protein NXI27_14550 [Alphaproteobacteria bacterium]|nr:hypothetical protein [Alphaproteobacteria bacterium]
MAIVLGLIVAVTYWRLSGLQAEVDALSGALEAERANSVSLSEQVASHQQALTGLSAALRSARAGAISELEQQYIGAASARLEAAVAREIAALGTSGFRFNMVEFDRRSCAQGGIFTGEHPDGYQQNEPFEPNHLVEVLETTEDVRGIPFYRVKINGTTIQWQDGPAIFRHGRMRIECN